MRQFVPMEDSEYGYLAAPEGLGPPAAMDPARTEQQHQDPLLQLQQGRADSEEKPLLRKGSLRSALVRDGKYSRRQASSRVRFAEPLVESYFSVPCCDKTPRMVSIVSGEDGGAPWGDILREDSETDIELEVSMSGRYINNPVYGGRNVFLGEELNGSNFLNFQSKAHSCMSTNTAVLTDYISCVIDAVTDGGARSASAVERGYYGCNYHWGMAGSNANPLHQEPETELLCGVGLAWML